jgi:hypothetical protein
VLTRRALLSLSSGGIELFESPKRIPLSANDGKSAFADEKNPGQFLLKLDSNATQCSPSFWEAYQLQHSRLLLLHKLF